ncbi:cytoskeletal protein binding protein, partial [Coemansia sp. RSA 2706]
IKPITRAKGLYDYEPTLAEETTLNVDEEVDIVEDDDPEWYMAKTKGGYGFVPKAYVEIVPSSEPPAPELPAAPELSPAVALPPPPPPPLPAAEPPTSETLAFDLPAFSLPAFEPPAPEPAAVTTTTTATLPPPPLPPSQPASEPPAATISHFNVMLGKKKKAQKITLGVSNPTLIVDSNEDTVPPKRFATGDISKCVVKKSVLTVEIGGYQPTTFDFNCTSNGEAERISDSINAARRGMFIGDRPLDVPQAKEAPASMPVQTMTIAQEHARVLYDFASDDSEELTVAEGDRVLVLDKSDAEWWQVQLAPPHGRAGLVPAAYVELCHDKLDSPLPSAPPALPAKDIAPVLPAKEPEFLHSPVEQPDLLQFATDRSEAPPLPSKQSDAIPQLPMRQPEPQRPIDNSIIGRGKTPDSDNMPLQLLQKPAVEAVPALPAKGPDPSKVRTWTDGSGAYTVEAEFLRLDNDGNVHLHKTNGKTITVAMAKFSDADRRYVAGLTGQPPKLPTKSKTARQRQQEQAQQTPGRRIINYDWDWFDFFTLKCGVTADNALKYATSFVAERLDDASIPEIDANYMRTLGVKPADIPRLERAILEHQGKAPPEPAKEPVKERAPSPRGLAMEP